MVHDSDGGVNLRGDELETGRLQVRVLWSPRSLESRRRLGVQRSICFLPGGAHESEQWFPEHWRETRIPAENLNSGGGRVLVMPPGMGRSLGDTCFVFKMGQQISTAFTSGLISKGCNFLVCKDRRGTRYLNFSVPVLHFVGCNSNFGQISTRLPLQCKLTPVVSVSPESPPRHHCVAWSNRPDPCEVARSGQLKVTFLKSIWPFILGGGVRKYGRKRYLFFQFDR
jgi:hypothetical protein